MSSSLAVKYRSAKRSSRRGGLRTLRDWIVFVLLSAFGLCFLVPLYIAITNAMKPPAQAGVANMWQLPSTFDLSSFAEAFERLYPSLGNSFVIAVGATLGSAVFGAVNGYVLSKLRFRGADMIMVILMFGMFIPYQVVLVPLVSTLSAMGLYGSIAGLIFVHIVYGMPLTTLIFRNFYASIPDELLEAASIDGSGAFRTFFNVVLPLSGPGFVVVAIFQFTNIWNDFLFGLVVVPNPQLQPVTVALNNLSGSMAIDWSVVMAGAVLAAVPTGVVYILLGRFFVSGLMAGSLK